MITLNVNDLKKAEAFWQELGLEDVIALRQVERSHYQTISIPLETIDDLYDKLAELEVEMSEIVATVNGQHMFTFVGTEDNLFIVIGEWVGQPFNGDKRAEFFQNMKEAQVIEASKVDELEAGSLVLFGRVTCPWTRRFVKQLPGLPETKIYYVNTEDTDLNPILQEVRAKYDAPTVPTLIKKEADSFVKFNNHEGNLAEFVK